MHHTLALFQRLHDEAARYTPREVQTDIQQIAERLNSGTLTGTNIEEAMVQIGKKIWPYRKAFLDLKEAHTEALGEKLLLAKVSGEVKKHCEIFFRAGGTFADLHAGSTAQYFSPDDRRMLCEAFISLDQDINAHVRQTMHSIEADLFRRRVVHYTQILSDIEKELTTLSTMARQYEASHPKLSAEIREQVLAFEHGLCVLEKEPDIAAVCSAAEHFDGRRHDMHVMR